MRRSSARPSCCFALFVLVGFVATGCGGGDDGPAGPDSDTLEPTANISISGNLSVDRIIIPVGVTVTITGPTTIDVDGEVQILGTLTGDCHALTITGNGAGTIAGTIANHCTAGGAIGGNLEFTVDGPLSVTGTIRSAGNILIRNTPDIDASDLDGLFQSPPPGAPALQAGPSDDCIFDGADLLGAATDPAPAAAGQAGVDAPDVDVICEGDSELDAPNFDVGAEGQDGGGPAAPGGGPAGVSGDGGDGGDGSDFDFYTAGDLTINPSGSGILRLQRGGDGASSSVTATVPGQSATASGGDGGNGGGMRIGAGGSITIANTLTIVTGGGGHGGNANATGAKGNDGATTTSQPGGNATANGGNGGHTTEGRLRSTGAVSGTTNIQLDDGGNYGDGGNGGDATAIAGQGGNGGAFDPNGAIGGNMIAGGGDGGDVRTQGFSGAFVGDAGNGGDITVGGAGGGSLSPQLNVAPIRAPSMGGTGVNRCPPFTKGGDGGGGGSVLGNAAQTEPSQPGEGGDGGPGASSDGDAGRITVLNETGVGGKGGNGTPPGDGGAAGNGNGLGTGFTRVNGSPVFQPGAPGSTCTPSNTPPTLQNSSGSAPKNTPVIGTLTYTDAEGDLPNPATAVVNNLTPADAATVTNFEVATTPGPPPAVGLRFRFTPTTGFLGTVTFQISVNDARGALSNVATVTVVVTDTSILDYRLEFSTPFEAGNTYERQMTNVVTGSAAGTMQYGAVGTAGQFFTAADRHGMVGSASNKIVFHFGSLDITADPNAELIAWQVCVVNSSGSPVTITYFGPAAAPPRGGAESAGPAQFPPPSQLVGTGCMPITLTGDAVRAEMTAPSGAVFDVLEPTFKVEVINVGAG